MLKSKRICPSIKYAVIILVVHFNNCSVVNGCICIKGQWTTIRKLGIPESWYQLLFFVAISVAELEILECAGFSGSGEINVRVRKLSLLKTTN